MVEKPKFLDNFDPNKSTRERRKLTRKSYTSARKPVVTLYDERGIHKPTGKNLCDCLEEDCPGCHMPCPKCWSNMCGHECRVNRKWAYDQIEMDGSDIIIRNPNK